MKYCKYILILLTAVVLGVWVYLVYDINRAYPSPAETVHELGQTFEYYGLEITPKSVEIYSYEEMCGKYTELQNTGAESKEKNEYMYVIATVHIKNVNINEIVAKDSIVSYWTMETGIAANGMNNELAYIVDYSSNTFENGFDKDIEIPFCVLKDSIENRSKEEILSQGIKIVMNYYPHKEYILFH